VHESVKSNLLNENHALIFCSDETGVSLCEATFEIVH